MSDRFRHQCRALRVATLIVFFGLIALLSTGALLLPWWPVDTVEPEMRTQALALFAAQSLPTIGYLWALWSVQRALGDLAAGLTFNPTLVRAIRHIGIGVLTGSLIKVFVVINLTRWVLNVSGSYAYFDIPAIVLGVVGAALILLARVVEEARRLRSELDEIF